MGQATLSVGKQGQSGMEAISGEEKLVFDADRDYTYTWPGQKEATIKGAELQKLVAGADPSMLNIIAIYTEEEQAEQAKVAEAQAKAAVEEEKARVAAEKAQIEAVKKDELEAKRQADIDAKNAMHQKP